LESENGEIRKSKIGKPGSRFQFWFEKTKNQIPRFRYPVFTGLPGTGLNIYIFCYSFTFYNIYIFLYIFLVKYIYLSTLSFSPGRFNTQPPLSLSLSLTLSFSLSRVTFHAPLLRQAVSFIIECFLIFDLEEWRSEVENQLQTYFSSVAKDMWLLEQIL
jgi:hypothetical protein